MISVVVIDDSRLIRKRTIRLLESDRRISVGGFSDGGDEAVEEVATCRPDVVIINFDTLREKGRQTLSQLRKILDVPAVIISSSPDDQEREKRSSIPVEWVNLPPFVNQEQMETFRRDLVIKVRAAALKGHGNRKKIERIAEAEKEETHVFSSRIRRNFLNPAVALGISTGGPKRLLEIFPHIPADFPAPIFLTQHMPSGFTKSLAQRLDSISPISVKEARNGEKVKRSVCYLAPGDQHLTVVSANLSKGAIIKITPYPGDVIYRPSVDVMMDSVVRVYGSDTIGVIMTGMGSDGTKGMREIKKRGGVTIAEHSDTCIVYGMPRSVIESGLADIVVPSHQLTSTLISLLRVRYVNTVPVEE